MKKSYCCLYIIISWSALLLIAFSGVLLIAQTVIPLKVNLNLIGFAQVLCGSFSIGIVMVFVKKMYSTFRVVINAVHDKTVE